MERWPNESDAQYADRVNTARIVSRARSNYEQSDAYREALANSAAYNATNGSGFRKVNAMAPEDDIDDLRDQLDALRGGLGESFDALNTGMADNTATLRSGLGLDTTAEARAWAEEKLAESDPYLEQEQALRDRYGQVTKSTVERLRAAREKLAGRKVDKTDFWLAMAQGAAMPNQGGKLGWTGNVAAAVRPALAGQQQFRDDQQAGLDEYDTLIEDSQRGETDLDLRLLQERRKAWDAERLRAAQILGKSVPGSGTSSGAGAKRFDQAVGAENIEWLTKNGPVFERSINELERARDMIRNAKAEGKNVSGRDTWAGWLSLFGDFGEKLTAMVDPLASDIQNMVLNTVQQTLRPTLGAQFTEREGQRVLARAYDPKKPEEVNISRIQALLTQIQKQAANSRSMAEWFAANDGDMTGYRMSDAEAAAFENAMYQAMDDAERSLGLNKPQGMRPGTIVLEPKAESAPAAASGPRPGEVIDIDETNKKEERGFLDRVWPFAKGGSVGYAEGGDVATEEDDRVPALLPDGRTVFFAPGTTEEQVREWYAGEQRKEQRRESLLNLGAGAAAGGAGTGVGYFAMRAAEGAAERMPGSPLRINSGVRRTADKANAERVNLSNAAQDLRKLHKLGIPAVGLDVLPQEIRGLVNEAMRSGSPETARLQELLSGRNRDARANRLPDAINRVTQADPYLDQQAKLKTARFATADPLYQQLGTAPWVKEKAFDRVTTNNIDQNFIDWMSETAVGREAIARANSNWTVDKANAGKAPVKTSATGMPSAYDVRYLDQIKQALDDLEADATGKNYSARDVAKIRRRLIEQIDAARPDYAAARGAYSEGSRPLTALSIGRGGDAVRDLVYQDVDGNMVRAKGFMEMSPEEAKRYVSGFKQMDEIENLRSGVAEALNREIRGTSAKSNPAAAMLENPDRMALMQILLEPKDFKRLTMTLEHEARTWDTSGEFGRKTESARGRARGAPVTTASKVTSAAKATPGVAVRALNPFAWLYRATVPPAKTSTQAKDRKIDSKEADDIVKIASTKRAQDLERLAKAAGRRGTRGRRAGKAGLITGAGAAGASLYENFAGDDEAEEQE